MKPPTFDPWVGRIKIARTWIAVLGFVLVGTLGYTSGQAWDESIARALVAAVACYFIGWASALWICGELYNVQVSRLKSVLEAREAEREQKIRDMYEARFGDGAQDEPGGVAAMPSAPQPSGLRDAA